MSEKRLAHLVLVVGALLFLVPVWLVFSASTYDTGAINRGEVGLLPHLGGMSVYADVLAGRDGAPPVWRMLWISTAMSLAIAATKIVVSVLAAYAVAFFRFPFRRAAFWTMFITLMLPVEVRIIPTYGVVAALGMVSSFPGLVVPLTVSATATLLLRQVFTAVPDDLMDAARIDGAGPLRFLVHVLVPVSAPTLAALFVILFVYGWNQYLWPLVVTTDPQLDTVTVGIVKMIGVEADTRWNQVMATTVLALIPPTVVVVAMQRWFVKGLTDSDR